MAANSSLKTAPQCTLTTISTRSAAQPERGELRVRSLVFLVFTKAKNPEHLESFRIADCVGTSYNKDRTHKQTIKQQNLLKLQLVVWFSPKPD